MLCWANICLGIFERSLHRTEGAIRNEFLLKGKELRYPHLKAATEHLFSVWRGVFLEDGLVPWINLLLNLPWVKHESFKEQSSYK